MSSGAQRCSVSDDATSRPLRTMLTTAAWGNIESNHGAAREFARRPLDPGSAVGNWMVLHDLVDRDAHARARSRSNASGKHCSIASRATSGTSQNRPRESPYGLGRRYQNPRIRSMNCGTSISFFPPAHPRVRHGRHESEAPARRAYTRLTGGAAHPKSSSLSAPCPPRIRVGGGGRPVARRQATQGSALSSRSAAATAPTTRSEASGWSDWPIEPATTQARRVWRPDDIVDADPTPAVAPEGAPYRGGGCVSWPPRGGPPPNESRCGSSSRSTTA